jgi:hypothetical protein
MALQGQSPSDPDPIEAAMGTLIHRANVLRQINSDKMFRTGRRSLRWNIGLVVATTAVGFFGFTGTDRLRTQLAGVWSISNEAVAMLYNVLVLITIVIAIVILVCRFSDRSAQHLQGVRDLAAFAWDLEVELNEARAGERAVEPSALHIATARYHGIAMALPPSSDKDYQNSKAKLRSKQARKRWAAAPANSGGAAESESVRLGDVLARLPDHAAVLGVVHEVGEELGVELLVIGGFVRNAVWDWLHDYSVPTPLDDVDVVYLSPPGASFTHTEVRDRLKEAMPNLRWSVKDVRMAKRRGKVDGYPSITASLQEAPETASSVAVRRDGLTAISVCAPLGVDDLLTGILRPSRPQARFQVMRRARTKRWLTTWPDLLVADMPWWYRVLIRRHDR